MPEARKCSSCGAEVPADSPSPLCPLCSPSASMSTAISADKVGATSTIVVSHPLSEKPGDKIGRYKLLEQIGEGGFGVVYVAEQVEPVRRRVALKVIKLGMDTKEVIARFEAERQALALMDHPNIAKVLDAGATGSGRPYFVMELVKGERITDYCDKNNLTTRQRLDLFVQICHAIQHAHQKGIIHRDIKPSNILVAMQDGVPVPKVIDFGIAKATEQRLTEKTFFTSLGDFVGTPAYMSPEQAEMTGLDIDTRSDIYSLGVLLYELLTGKTPFDPQELLAKGMAEMRRAIRAQEPQRPSTRLTTMEEGELTTTAKHRQTDAPKLVHLVRGDLDWIAMKCLEKDRTRRYDTANGLAFDLLRHLNNEPVLARPPSNVYRFQKMVWRNKLAFAAGTAVGAAVLVGLAVSTFLFIQERRAHARALAQEHVATEALGQVQDAMKIAALEANRAQAAATEARNALAASDFFQAVRFIAEDKDNDAVAYLAACLRLNPAHAAAATRLAALLAYHPWCLPAMVLPHRARVSSGVFSPDGNLIVTAAADNTARVWDPPTGRLITDRPKHEGNISTVQFSPDGKRIVTASPDHTARVWDAQTGQPLTQPLQHPDQVWSAQFSADGTRLLTVCSDRTARIWDAGSGQPLSDVLTNRGGLDSAQFSPDGNRIVTILGFTARVLDPRTGQPVLDPLRHLGPLYSAQFSPDGKQIVTASADGTAMVWDAQTGKPATAPLRHAHHVFSAQFSRDGTRIVTASADGTARVWNAQTGLPLTEPIKHSDQVLSAQFSVDGKRIVTVCRDRTVRIWDAQSGQPLTEPLTHGSDGSSAQLSPDGNRILTISNEGGACVWNARPGEVITDPLQHGATFSSAQFSPDGKRIVTASSDHTARVWDAQTGQPLTEPLQHAQYVASAQFSPDGNRIVTASWDKSARVWDAQTGQPLAVIQLAGRGFAAQFSPEGNRIVTASDDGSARVWEAQSGQPLTEPLKHPGWVLLPQFSPDGKRILTAAEDSTARVWDALTGQLLTGRLKHNGNVSSVQFSPDGKRIVTASSDGTARVWNAETGEPLTEPLKHGAFVRCARFSPDGKQVVTASSDHTAQVWDAQSGRPLTSPLKHAGDVWWAEFSPDGRRIATASWDNTARVWDAQNGQPLTEPLKLGRSVVSAQFSSDGKQILTRSYGPTIVWDIAPPPLSCPEWFLRLAEVVSGETLNDRGIVDAVRLDRTDALNHIREDLARVPDTNDWVVWGRWFLADTATRTISPFSKITVPAHINSRTAESATNHPVHDARRGPGNAQ